MDDLPELTLHERIQILEEESTSQKAQIEALRGAVSVLLTAHAMQTGDTKPIAKIREYCDYNYERGKAGGTERIPASFFTNRSGAFADLLENIYCSDFSSNYWRRSVFEWLDERRYQKVQKVKDQIDELAGL